MGKEHLKICVYAICKNESKFVDRWVNALKEADCIVVLDTGSTDNTVELLEQYSPFVTVQQKIIDPWRFDTARNESMKLIPEDADICVVSDFDQIFQPGWADELRFWFKKGYEEVYGPIIDYDDDNKEIKRFLSKNVHPNRKEWYWERPIHEGISYHGPETILSCVENDFVIEHHPDTTKSRDGYLTLLEHEYEEHPTDPMCCIYYGCELCFHGRDDEGMQIFLNALDVCDFTNYPEVGYQTYLNIADGYKKKGDYETAVDYASSAMKFGIITRRLYMTIASIYYVAEEYFTSIQFCMLALRVKQNALSWIEDNYYFNGGVYDTIALCYYALKEYSNAIAYGYLAESADPSNDRFRDNLSYYKKMFNEKGGDENA